jgi:hypothetical protein
VRLPIVHFVDDACALINGGNLLFLQHFKPVIYNHKNDGSASIFGMMREERNLKFKFES